MDDVACRTVRDTYAGGTSDVHGQHTVPQLARMLSCRVNSCTPEPLSHTQVTDQPHTRTPSPMDDASCRTVTYTHVGGRPDMHGLDTAPQFVCMLYCRVIS